MRIKSEKTLRFLVGEISSVLDYRTRRSSKRRENVCMDTCGVICSKAFFKLDERIEELKKNRVKERFVLLRSGKRLCVGNQTGLKRRRRWNPLREISSCDECISRIAEDEVKKRGQARDRRSSVHRRLLSMEHKLERKNGRRYSLLQPFPFIRRRILFLRHFHDIFTKHGETRRPFIGDHGVEKENRGWWNVARIETKSGAVAFVRDRFWAEDFPAAARRRVSIRASLNRGSVSF